MPVVGLGVYQVPNEEVTRAILSAVDIGYRSIDTAAAYRNELGVGEALAAVDVSRDDLFITTKVWNTDHGYDATLRSFDESMRKLQLERLDLYLIHWPVPSRDLYVDTWRALIKLRNDGRVSSIGVSNFQAHHLERLKSETGVGPAVNQIELHPRFQQKQLRQYHDREGIITEAWSPLDQGRSLREPTLQSIAARHHKTPAQIVLRWHLEMGNVVIPKSKTPQRMMENFSLSDFQLSSEDLALMNSLDERYGKMGPALEDYSTF